MTYENKKNKPMKMLISVIQPDARKSDGAGQHFSNAIGFYIIKGNPSRSRGRAAGA